MSYDNEVWKDIKGCEGLYQVSNLGRVRSIDHYRKCGKGGYITKGKVLKQNFDGKKRYLHVILSKGKKTRTVQVHTLVGKHFVEGYKKGLEINGVGYRFTPKGNTLTINAGYSHPVNIEVPNGITIKGISNTEIEIEGIDKCQVSEFAANIRKVRKPEPYKGKGIKYKGEHIRRKEGKKASK